MRAGQLRHPITIEAPVEGQPWIPFCPLRARIQDNDGSEPFMAQAVAADVSHWVHTRYRAGITPLMRIRFGSRLFDIQHLGNVDERSRELRIEAKEQLGVAVTFTRTTQAYDEATGGVTPTVTTIAGSALQVAGDPERYKALGLVLTAMPTLFFRPSLYGQSPQPGDVVTWAGAAYTVKDVERIAPNGPTVAAQVIIGQ